MRRRLPWWGCLLVVLAQPTLAAETPEAPTPVSPPEEKAPLDTLETTRVPSTPQTAPRGPLRKTWRHLENLRDAWSQDVAGVGRAVDGFFAGEAIEDLPNRSYVRLGYRTTFSEDDAREEDDTSINLKLDLPRTKRRWKLFLESDNPDTEGLQDKTRDVITDEASTVGGVRLENDRSRHWRFTTDVGIRSRLPLDPFIRWRARRDFGLPGSWAGRFTQEAWYYHEKRFGELTQLDFVRPVGEDKFISVSSAAQFQDRFDILELAQTVSFTHRLSGRHAISYHAGVLGVNKPSVKSTAYYLSLSYRRRLHEDWVLLEVYPELLFPRSDGFRSTLSVTVELQLLFTEG